MVVAPYDMRDVHERVVDNGGEVVRRHAIGAHYDEVADVARIEGKEAVDPVGYAHILFRHAEADREGRVPGHRYRVKVSAPAVLPGRHACRGLFSLEVFKLFFRAIALVRIAFVYEPYSRRLVEGFPFGLAVRAVYAALVSA